MTDLDEKEQNHVRTALRYLRRRAGAWAHVAKVLGYQPDTLEKVANARGRSVTASMAMRTARVLGTSVDALIAGQFLPGACPKCGHTPDFADEPTRVDAVADDPAPLPPSLGGGLKLVK